jgi:pectate lyase
MAMARLMAQKVILGMFLAGAVLAGVACSDAADDTGGRDGARGSADAAFRDALVMRDGATRDGTVPDGAARDGATDSAAADGAVPGDGAVRDGAVSEDATPRDAAPPADGGPVDAARPRPVDCSPIASRAEWQVCLATDDTCEAVFNDSAGCAALCAAAGLVCGEQLENVNDQCAPDRARPALDCAGSGHASDYCVCVRGGECVADCGGRACGSDGCGGSCGPCGNGQRCEAGACVDAPLDCDGYPFSAESLLAERVGFGRGVTGGDPNRIYRVRNGNDRGEGSLRAALESDERWWIVFDHEGVIRLNTPIEVRSHKTVDGRGRDVRIIGQFAIRAERNIIFSDVDVTMENPEDGADDLFSIRGVGGDTPADFEVRGLWFHHLALHFGGDGLIDIRGGTEVTISWNHLYNHTKAMLHTQDANNEYVAGMHITYHHNFFDRTSRRGPHFARGKADFFNNYHYQWYEYGAGSVNSAQFLSENNIYEAREGEFCIVPCPDPAPHGGGNDFIVSKRALVHDWATDEHGFIRSSGELLLNGAQVEPNAPERVFARADFYPAVVEPATPELAARIRAEAGPRVDYCR